jgi:hypothetical protein
VRSALLLDAHVVDHRVEHAAQADRRGAVELVAQQLAVERAHTSLDRIRQDAQHKLEIRLTLVALEQLAEAFSDEAPLATPAARPASFCTGRAIAKLTARTAVSTLSAASTALSVTRSILSSCPLTRSTEPPTLLITGRVSLSTPRINEERR